MGNGVNKVRFPSVSLWRRVCARLFCESTYCHFQGMYAFSNPVCQDHVLFLIVTHSNYNQYFFFFFNHFKFAGIIFYICHCRSFLIYTWGILKVCLCTNCYCYFESPQKCHINSFFLMLLFVLRCKRP